MDGTFCWEVSCIHKKCVSHISNWIWNIQFNLNGMAFFFTHFDSSRTVFMSGLFLTSFEETSLRHQTQPRGCLHKITSQTTSSTNPTSTITINYTITGPCATRFTSDVWCIQRHFSEWRITSCIRCRERKRSEISSSINTFLSDLLNTPVMKYNQAVTPHRNTANEWGKVAAKSKVQCVCVFKYHGSKNLSAPMDFALKQVFCNNKCVYRYTLWA